MYSIILFLIGFIIVACSQIAFTCQQEKNRLCIINGKICMLVFIILMQMSLIKLADSDYIKNLLLLFFQ